MREFLLELLESAGQLTVETIATRLAAASILACFIFLSYWLSHDGSIYSKKFNISLVAMTVITTTVMIVIGNNIALSLGRKTDWYRKSASTHVTTYYGLIVYTIRYRPGNHEPDAWA